MKKGFHNFTIAHRRKYRALRLPVAIGVLVFFKSSGKEYLRGSVHRLQCLMNLSTPSEQAGSAISNRRKHCLQQCVDDSPFFDYLYAVLLKQVGVEICAAYQVISFFLVCFCKCISFLVICLLFAGPSVAALHAFVN